MQHDRKIAFVGVGGAKRPIVRNRDMQDLPELFRRNLSHLLDILRISKVPADGWDNEAERPLAEASVALLSTIISQPSTFSSERRA